MIMQLAGVGAGTSLSWEDHWDAGSAMGRPRGAQGRWLGSRARLHSLVRAALQLATGQLQSAVWWWIAHKLARLSAACRCGSKV